MCQQVIQFCSSSTKPLLFSGGSLSLILAIAYGYTSCTSFSLYRDLGQESERSLIYYLQLFTAGYLTLIALFTCVAAHLDQKHSTRTLAILTGLNFLLSFAVLALVINRGDLTSTSGRLLEAEKLYDFTHKIQDQSQNLNKSTIVAPNTASSNGTNPEKDINQLETKTALSKETATIIWDRLQNRGCCGYKNFTEWKSSGIPKSCCEKVDQEESGDRISCKKVDAAHERGCEEIIKEKDLHAMIVLGMIAMVSLFLAAITCLNHCQHLHYNEASQSAYT